MSGQRSERGRRYSTNIDKAGDTKRTTSNDSGQHLIGVEDTVYRYLCPLRKTGSIIGKGGDIVKQLRAESMANINISAVVAGAEERVITIFSSSEETSFVEETGELVSPAQVALYMVHSRIAPEEQASDDDAFEKPHNVVIRMLIPSDQIGCIIGKSGQVIQNIRIETGAQIRILKDKSIPLLALPSDQLLQIVGEPQVAKLALQEVASRIHENPSRSQHHLLTSSMNGSLNSGTILRLNSNGSGVGLFDHRDEIAKEFSLRLLCRIGSIGAVIGKGGGVIQQIRQESRASIKVDSSSAEGDDSIIFISAEEIFEEYSPTMIAALALQPRCSERVENESGVSVLTTRVLVHRSQIGCLLGKGGSIISDMRNVTRANIKIFSNADMPNLASEEDEMVLISGSLDVATSALSQVILRLKSNLFGYDGALTPIVPSIPHVQVFSTVDRHSRGNGYSSDLASQANYGGRDNSMFGCDDKPGVHAGSSLYRSGSSKRRHLTQVI